MKAKTLTVCGLMAAVMCICSAISIPTGGISVTLGIFGVLFTPVLLGQRLGVGATAVFILLGAVGLPVFSDMRGGLGMLVGPTGGYIYGYIFMALTVGFAADKLSNVKSHALKVFAVFVACLVGVAVDYTLGTAQFMAVTGRGLKESLAMCVLPFALFDAAKSVAASVLGLKLRALIKP